MQYQSIPVVPPDFGAVLADAAAWHEWALAIPAPSAAPRVRRPGRIRNLAAAGLRVLAVAVAGGAR